jgi:hypothetical protein
VILQRNENIKITLNINKHKLNRMEQKTLKWLDISEMKILKQIFIISDGQQGESVIGRVVYTRPLTIDYNLKKQQDEGNKLDRFLNDYPRQENYPTDRIDEIIFDSIRKAYPKSKLRNDTILFNVDLDKISILRNRKIIKSAIYFSPEFSNITSIFDYVGKSFQAPQIKINIYSDYNPAFLDGQIFYAEYDVSEETVLEKLKTVNFE